jgi:hypothetical protein
VSVTLLYLHLMILKTSTSKEVPGARQNGKISNTSVSKLLISFSECIIAGGCSDGRTVAQPEDSCKSKALTYQIKSKRDNRGL